MIYIRRKKEVSSPTPFRVRTAFKAGLASSPVFLPLVDLEHRLRRCPSTVLHPRGLRPSSSPVSAGGAAEWSVRESNPLRRDLQSPALPIELTDQYQVVDKLGVAPSRSVCKTELSPLRQARESFSSECVGHLWSASLKQPSMQRTLRVGPTRADEHGGRQRTRTSRSCPRESRSRRSSLPANLPSKYQYRRLVIT
jgi:hypothetical protein